METFSDHVDRLRQERTNWSQSRLITEATSYGTPGRATDTIRNAVTGRRNGWPSIVAIEAIARALNVDPMEFAVYRIQRARELLDPATASYEAAVANADALLSLSLRTPAEIAKVAAQRHAGTTPASPTAARSSE